MKSEIYAIDESPTVRERLVKETENVTGLQESFSSSQVRRKAPEINLQTKNEPVVKQAIDLVLGSAGLILFLFLYPVIAFCIKLSSAGPVIYRQQRTGRNGHEFICYKFRTMHQVELRRIDGKPVITREGDKRIFWFGSLLRKLNLDELPQIINVLKGEMSLVGPRPYPVRECAYWNSRFEDFYYRYSVKPGISGLAQTRGYRGGTLDENHMRKRLDYDLIYVQKSNPLLDLRIIGRTVLQMLHLNTNAH